ncbi:MAG: glycosyltransferase, partial [Alphaproteobacteria bacterium]
QVPFADRENGFVMIGRVVPSKRVELAVEIVRQLREHHGHTIQLHIIGRADNAFAETLKQLLSDKPWAHWHSDLDRTGLERLAGRMKWGLHCYRYEHYGLAPAELQALGCITFVHDSGGQREIVTNPSLRYQDLEDAVRKITAVMTAPAMQSQLLAEIELSNMKHRAERFDRGYVSIVKDLLALHRSEAPPSVNVSATG